MGFWDWLEVKDESAAPVEVNIPDGEERVRYQLRFHGQVQGVGFRYTIQMVAREYKVTGWARNEHDGSVSAELQGYPKDIRRTVNTIQTQSRFIRIDRIDAKKMEPDVHETGFRTY